VPVFSLASLLGAVVVELKYANAYLDKLDYFRALARKTARRRRDADGRLERLRQIYDALEVRLETLWSTYEPSWVMQADIAAQRIAAARAKRPDLFHPLGPDIKPIIEDRLTQYSRVLDVHGEISQRGLAATEIMARAAATVDEVTNLEHVIQTGSKSQTDATEQLTELDLERLRSEDDATTAGFS